MDGIARFVGPIDRGTLELSSTTASTVWMSFDVLQRLAVDDVVVTFKGLEEQEVDNVVEARWWNPARASWSGISLSNLDVQSVAQVAADAVQIGPSGRQRLGRPSPR